MYTVADWHSAASTSNYLYTKPSESAVACSYHYNAKLKLETYNIATQKLKTNNLQYLLQAL